MSILMSGRSSPPHRGQGRMSLGLNSIAREIRLFCIRFSREMYIISWTDGTASVLLERERQTRKIKILYSPDRLRSIRFLKNYSFFSYIFHYFIPQIQVQVSNQNINKSLINFLALPIFSLFFFHKVF